MIKCEICNEEFNDVKSFHTHIKKSESILISDYYYQYVPRYDKYNNKLIKYKSRDFYLSNDFNSRSNFLKWFIQNIHKQETSDYCYKKLEERIKEKKLKFNLSQAELSSIKLPNIIGFEKISSINTYINFCKKHKLIKRFDYKKEKIHVPNKKIKIIVDTREKKPLNLNSETVSKKLEYGDYAIKNNSLAIERKSIADFIGTMSSGYERFLKEIERSNYLIVLIENNYKKSLNYIPYVRRGKANFQKAGGSFAFKRMREIMENNINTQFLFVNDRQESAEMCEKLLKLPVNKVKKIDLQWAYDSGLI